MPFRAPWPAQEPSTVSLSRYGARVSRIEVANGRARAVHTASGERIPADVVLVNGDPAVAYRTLLTANENPPRVRHLRYSPSCVVLHAGSSAAYAHTAHHTIEFGEAWERTFREIIADGQLMSDPSFLVTTPTKSDPGLAPPGKNVLRPCSRRRTSHIADLSTGTSKRLDTGIAFSAPSRPGDIGVSATRSRSSGS